MGIASSSLPKTAQEQLCKEYEQKLYTLDDTVVDLLKALDVMDATSESLLTELQTNFEDQATRDVHIETFKRLASRLLTAIRGSVIDKRDKTICTLVDLLEFVKKTITDNVKLSTEFRRLQIKRYKSSLDKQNLRIENKHIQALSVRHEDQLAEIHMLKQQIKALKEKDATFLTEKCMLREKLNTFEVSEKQEIQNLQEQLENMKKEKDTLQSNLDCALLFEKKYNEKVDKISIMQLGKTENEIYIQDMEKTLICNDQEKSRQDGAIAELQLTTQRLEEEKKKLEQMLGECECREETLRKQHGELEKTNMRLSQDAGNETTSFIKTIDRVTTQDEIRQEEKMKIYAKYERLKTRNRTLKQEADEKEREHHAQKEEIKNNLREQIDSMGKENMDLSHTVKELQQGIKAKNEDVEEMKQKITSLTKESKDYKERFGKVIDGLTSQFQFFKQQSVKLKTELEQYEEQNKDLRQKIKEKENETAALNHEKQNIVTEHKQMTDGLQEKINVLNEQLNDLNEKLAYAENEMQQVKNNFIIERDNYKMKTEHELILKDTALKSNEKKLDILSRARSSCESKIAQLETKNNDLDKQYQKEIEENKHLSQENEKLLDEIRQKDQKHRRDLDTKEQKVTILKDRCYKIMTESEKKKDEYEANLKAHTDRNESLRKSLSDKHELLEIANKENIEKDTKIAEKNKIIIELKDQQEYISKKANTERESFMKKRQELEYKLQETNNERRVIEDTLMKCQVNCASKETELAETTYNFNESKEIIAKLEETQQQQLRRLGTIQKELDHLKSKKVIPVQLYCQKRSDLVKNIEKRLIKLLQNEFSSDRLELEFWECSRTSDLHPTYPLLVECITVSRIGTDVANAVQGLTLSPNMAALVFHHKDEHALPSQLSERILTGTELKGIGGIFDMAFFSGKGIYPCEMNSNSSASLVTFIKRVARQLDM